MPKATVLIVDDDTDSREILAFVLQDAGYRVEAAGGTVPAIRRLAASRPDLVLLDLVMPELDGWRVLEFVSSLPAPPPVLVVTGAAHYPPPPALRPWLSGYLLKPFHVRRLLRCCDHALRMSREGGAELEVRSEVRRLFVSDATLHRASGQCHDGVLHEISACGFRVHVETELRVGEDVRVDVHVPWYDRRVPLAGRIRWARLGLHGAQAMVLDEMGGHVQRLLGAAAR